MTPARFVLVLLMPMLCAAAVYGQSTSFDRVAQCFQSLQTLMPTRYPPTEAEMRRIIEGTTRCGWELVREKLTPTEAAVAANLNIQFEEGQGPAARVQGRTIYVSYDGIAQAGQVGQVVGHDIFVDAGNVFDVPSKVAYGPLATQPIVGLTNRLSGWIDGGAAATACQKNECKAVQGIALFVGIQGFLLAHEAAHVILRHGITNIDQNELDADRWAYGLIRRYDKDLADPDFEVARTAGRLAPVIYFDYLRSRLTTEGQLAETAPEVVLIERRRRQLAELADADDRLTLDTLAPSVDTGVGRIAISVEGQIGGSAKFWIDGVPLSAGDVLGQDRVVGAGLRHIAARSNGRFAYVTALVSPGEREAVTLRFLSPLPSVSIEELQGMVAQPRVSAADWAQIFLRTTDAAGNPRSPAVAMFHYQALARMRLGTLIPDVTPEITDARVLRNVNRWREQARPLAKWW